MLILNALKAIFATPQRIFIAAVLVILALAGGAVLIYRSERDTARAQVSQERLNEAYAQVKAVDAARLEEQRRTAAQTEIANAAKKDADGARADARDAGAAADRLRQRVNDLLAAARAGKDSAAPSGGATTGDPLGVLADVLERADRRAGILAEYADAARVAGQACERAYDSLTPEKKP
ncbi:ABC-type Na+ efflux pump permease subunit [Cupriavidus metallidurans]|uniref:DUF2514 family protein n=1 Tax=Cupriavidus metallidurans TaxID=119219 RepID=UPI0006908271|nr:DUF2514 family protein [Cupriavidus metallidurans]MDE4918532.1 DUF2514 family protein [Cupriavidus metallidurans]